MSIKRWEESTFYEIIEVDPNASSREIHAAYMRAKQTYSPDSPALYTMFSPEEARELMQMIDEAFTTLSHQARRQQYDLQLARQGHPIFSELLKKDSSEAKSTGTVSTVKLQESPTDFKKEPLMPSRSSLKKVLDPGFVKTKFGSYKSDPLLEKEILEIQECDGSFIKKIRTYKNVELAQLSEATRISKTYLSAVEDDALELLPAPVFVRGFVLQIARALGVPDRLADAYMKKMRHQLGSS